MNLSIITTEEELVEEGLMHYIVCNKASILYEKEFLSIEAVRIAAHVFGEELTENDCNSFTRRNEVSHYEHEKWEKIKQKKYPGFIGVYGKLFATMADVPYPY